MRDRVRKTTIRRNGSVAVRYLTCADDLIDFQMEKYTMIHAVIKHATSSHLKIPGSSMPLLICRTLLLNRKVIILSSLRLFAIATRDRVLLDYYFTCNMETKYCILNLVRETVYIILQLVDLD